MDNNFYVLVVEDNREVLDSLTLFVENLADVKILSANGYLEAAALISASGRIDLMLCDVLLREEMDGVDVAELAVKRHPRIAVVLLSAEHRSEIEGLCDRYSFVRKPFGRDELNEHIDAAFLKARAPKRQPIRS